MKAYLASLILSASPVAAWEFTATPVCTLTYEHVGLAVELTYDGALYTIRLNREAGWVDAPVFSMRFIPQGPAISTDRHIIDGNDLTVVDQGFGNVLNGLQFNESAIAVLGDSQLTIDLSTAADPVASFRDCDPQPIA